jgi:tRNA (cmo5U34)-methyltransferase
MERVKEAFDAIASDYDAQRRWIVPSFEDFYQNAVRSADWPGTDPAILDIGAGTGLLSALLIEKYPHASLTLMDISDNMLHVSRGRFSGRTGLIFRATDYRQADLGGPYDIVCSALSIHHLEHDEKRSLYKRIFAALNPGGVFVNAEQVEGETGVEHRRTMAYREDFFSDPARSRRLSRERLWPAGIPWTGWRRIGAPRLAQGVGILARRYCLSEPHAVGDERLQEVRSKRQNLTGDIDYRSSPSVF